MTLTLDDTQTSIARVILLDAAGVDQPQSVVIFRDQFLCNTIQVINPGGAAVKIFAAVLWNSDSEAPEWQQIGDDIGDSRIIVLDWGIYPYIRVERDEATETPVTVAIQSGMLRTG